MEMCCGPKCRSKQHIGQCIAALTKGNMRQCQLFLSSCFNSMSGSDKLGRTALHLAASTGHLPLIEWLIEQSVELNSKDSESSYTALHRALFYGQLSAARLLIQHGVNQDIRDREGLSALDIVMKDRLPHVTFDKGNCEVYIWGDNRNLTLGHETARRIRVPDLLETFSKQNISIKQVAMGKYHTIFLTSLGVVYACGHGRGGRLGHESENSILSPQIIQLTRKEPCKEVALGRDHTVLLMESGTVYTCGLNDSYQLGQIPLPEKCLTPKPIMNKALKTKVVLGISAGRYHTAMHTGDSIYTFGLNAGQLGHRKMKDLKITQPCLVAGLNHPDIHVKHMVSSDAAIVVVTSKGVVYVLHEYQCRKVASKCLDVIEVAVSGGHLDHDGDPDLLSEKGGSELVILLLYSIGTVHIWRESCPQLRRCKWNLRRSLVITHFALSTTNIHLVTADGELFNAKIPNVKSFDSGNKSISNKDFSNEVESFSMTLEELIGRDEIEGMQVIRVPGVHRATKVICDRKGCNFAVLQSHPKHCLFDVPFVENSQMKFHLATLLEEVDEFDVIHDVIIKIGKRRFAAHKFILSCRSDFFRKKFEQQKNLDVVELDEDTDVNLFEEIMKYIYTDDCSVLCIGTNISKLCPGYHMEDHTSTSKHDKLLLNEGIISQGANVSAFSVYQGKSKKKNKNRNSKKQEDSKLSAWKNPIKRLQAMAEMYGVKNMTNRLDSVKCIDGIIHHVPEKHLHKSNPKFKRTSFPNLYDVKIKGDNGGNVMCHKCILVARLEYFRSMLASGWIETSNSTSLTLPIPENILHIVLDFLYTDEAPVVFACKDPEFLCNILVIADQLLIERLKDMCEVAITNLLTLRSCCEILEFASIYNAEQLKTACQQYIIINLAALLEARCLEVLSDETIDELSTAYRNSVQSMSRRLITPYDEWPYTSDLESLEEQYQDLDMEIHSKIKNESLGSVKKSRPRRKRTKSKDDGSLILFGPPKIFTEHQTSHDVDPVLKLESISNDIHDVIEKGSMTIPLMAAHDQCNETDQHSDIFVESPKENVPVVDFRSIMAQQKKNEPMNTVIPVSSGGKKRGKKKSWRPLNTELDKISPKSSINSGGGDADINMIHEQAKPAWGSSGTAWGAMENVVKSFKDLIVDEVKIVDAPVATSRVQSEIKGGKSTMLLSPPRSVKGKRTQAPALEKTLSWGLPTSAVRKSPMSPTSPATSPPAENPWKKLPSSPPSDVSGQMMFSKAESPTGDMFASILKQEHEQKISLDKASKKPLHLIQIEEQAICELSAMYHTESFTSEFIVVERVTPPLATPTWAAAQRLSSRLTSYLTSPT